jgi:hypothetical protein
MLRYLVSILKHSEAFNVQNLLIGETISNMGKILLIYNLR